MATVLVDVQGVSLKRTRLKPKLLVRGQRRKSLVKLKRALQSLENQDFNEERRASNNGYTPYVIFGNPTSAYRSALVKLKARVEESLAAKA